MIKNTVVLKPSTTEKATENRIAMFTRNNVSRFATNINRRDRRSTVTSIVLFAFLSLCIFAVGVDAQQARMMDHSPDASLKSNARVNPSTLAMELSIPITAYPGRAGSNRTVSFDYSSKVWGFDKAGTFWSPITGIWSKVMPQYGKRTAGGWTSSLSVPLLEFDYTQYRGMDQDALYDGQVWDPSPEEEGPETYPLYYIKRAWVTLPGGSTHELRASDTPVNNGSTTGGTSAPDFNDTFLAVDGSRMRLEVTSGSTVLFLPDGGRYVFAGVYGTTYFDVHGNKQTYNSTSKEWTDTLGRVLHNPIPSNPNGEVSPSAGDVTEYYPGLGSDTFAVTLSWRQLKPSSGEGALLNPSDDLHYRSDRYCGYSTATLLSGDHLFGQGTSYNVRVCDPSSSSSQFTFNPVVLNKITFENGQSYEFKYNVYGEIVKVIYPTGAYERFEYTSMPSIQAATTTYDQLNRGVTDRYVSEKGDGSDEIHWEFSATRGTWQSPAAYKITTLAPDGTFSEQYVHDEPDENAHRPYGFSNLKTGRPFETRVYSSDSTPVLLRKTLTVYETTGPLSGGQTDASRDPRPTKEISIIFEHGESNALATMTETVYDTTGNSDAAYFSSLNAKQAKKYNYVVVSASTAASANLVTAAAWFSSGDLATVTEVDYLYDSNYKARNIVGLATETRVKDAAGNVKAKSQITYDGESLLDETESTRWENPSSIYRGLVTKTRNWYDIGGNLYIDTKAQYDLMGNLRKAWDGRDNMSETQYSSTYDYAYPTSVLTPIPDSAGTYGHNGVLTTTSVYDYDTGLALTVTDPNGAVAEMEYEDALYRPTKVIAPNDAETITEYGAGTSASTRWVKVSTQINATDWKEGYTWFDGLGRTYLSQSVDDEQDDTFVVTCFDNMGRVSKTSNPVRSSSAPTCASSLEWTTPGYDDIGRTITVTTPDSAVVETAYSLATSGSQIGTVVTVEDQAGKVRRSVTNGLGQLIRVDEPTTSGLGTISSPNQATTYAYDKLNNLTIVTQGSQTRTFTYDALSRLTQAVNPESGTINYTYDANSNLATKTDARSITTTYTYDRLNRVTLRNYSDSTPDVTYYYDALTNGKGKLKKVTSSVSTTEYTGYDISGRVTAHKQTTDSVDYTTSYSYDLGGNLLEQTYPSGRVVKNSIDSDGALSQVQSKRSSETYRNFANGFVYNAAGAVTAMKLGNGRWENTVFNSRLQPTQIGLGAGAYSQSLLKLEYEYGSTASVNNGNVTKQTITVPGVANPFVQTYAYDELNRLTTATETQNTTQTWKQTFTFDRYGNRNFDEANTTTLPKNCGTAPSLTVCAADRKIVNPSVNTANNRLSTSDDYSFDSVGNTTGDADGRTFVYDAENKQVSVSDTNGTIGEYFYDGDGRRVKKVVPGGETTIFVYDAGSKLIGEYSTDVQTGSNAKTAYTTNDHLGSPRINTDGTGQVISRHDYHPFGEEIARTGYGSDTIRKQFTGYERDGETGLDYAQARYYTPYVGRFMSPDDFTKDSDNTDPQSWNKYAAVRNNPLKYVDPTGEKTQYQITIDTEKRTITVIAITTIGIWSSNAAIKKDLSSVAKNIERQIEGKWKTSFSEKDGAGNKWKLDFKAEVSVQVFDKANSSADVVKANSSLMNVIEIDNVSTSYVNQNSGNGSPDTGKWDYSAAKNSGEPAHEYGHVAGGVNYGKGGGAVAGKDLIAPGTPQAKSMSPLDFDSVIGGRARVYRDWWINERKNDPSKPARQIMPRHTRVCCK